MDAFLMACAGLATVALLVAVAFLVRALEQVRLAAEQAARTGRAYEQLALHLDENVLAVGGAARRLSEFTDGLKSGWVRAAQFAVGLLATLREQWAQDAPAPRQAPEREAAETP